MFVRAQWAPTGLNCGIPQICQKHADLDPVSHLWVVFLAQPCVVSEWSHWSGCAQPCKPSIRVRRRSIERLPQNSGQACPRLEEQAGCMEYQDRQGQFCASVQGMNQHRLYFRPKCRTDVQHCNNFKVFHRQRICIFF